VNTALIAQSSHFSLSFLSRFFFRCFLRRSSSEEDELSELLDESLSEDEDDDEDDESRLDRLRDFLSERSSGFERSSVFLRSSDSGEALVRLDLGADLDRDLERDLDFDLRFVPETSAIESQPLLSRYGCKAAKWRPTVARNVVLDSHLAKGGLAKYLAQSEYYTHQPTVSAPVRVVCTP